MIQVVPYFSQQFCETCTWPLRSYSDLSSCFCKQLASARALSWKLPSRSANSSRVPRLVFVFATVALAALQKPHQNSTKGPPREKENCGGRGKKERNFGRSGGGRSGAGGGPAEGVRWGGPGGGAPKGGALKGGAPKGWEPKPRKVGPRRVGMKVVLGWKAVR